jgi:hypothetical protein
MSIPKAVLSTHCAYRSPLVGRLLNPEALENTLVFPFFGAAELARILLSIHAL